LRPKPVRDGMIRFRPSMEFSCHVSAYFNSHPTPTVVVDAIHVVACVACPVFLADHGMPGIIKVIPTLTAVRESNKNRTYCAAGLRIRRLVARQQPRNTGKMARNHFVCQDLA